MVLRLDVIGVANNPIRVLLIPAGEPSPNRRPTVKPTPKENLVEFYDLRKMSTPDGQFIAEYDTSTLLESSYDTGLDLHTSKPDWKIKARTKGLVLDWLYYHNSFKK